MDKSTDTAGDPLEILNKEEPSLEMPELLRDISIVAWQLVAALTPDPSWPDAEHHQCGYCNPVISSPYKFICLRTGRELPTAYDKACPAFVRRPEDGGE